MNSAVGHANTPGILKSPKHSMLEKAAVYKKVEVRYKTQQPISGLKNIVYESCFEADHLPPSSAAHGPSSFRY